MCAYRNTAVDTKVMYDDGRFVSLEINRSFFSNGTYRFTQKEFLYLDLEEGRTLTLSEFENERMESNLLMAG